MCTSTQDALNAMEKLLKHILKVTLPQGIRKIQSRQ